MVWRVDFSCNFQQCSALFLAFPCDARSNVEQFLYKITGRDACYFVAFFAGVNDTSLRAAARAGNNFPKNWPPLRAASDEKQNKTKEKKKEESSQYNVYTLGGETCTIGCAVCMYANSEKPPFAGPL